MWHYNSIIAVASKPRRGDIIIANNNIASKPRRGDIIIANNNIATPKG